MTVGERIQRKREELGMSQTELAKLMGYASKSAVSRAENSGDDIGANRIVKFAEALRTTPSYLMGWEEQEIEYQGPGDFDIEYDATIQEVIVLYSRLNPKQKATVLEMLRSFVV